MFRNALVLFGLVVVLGILSAVLTYIRAGNMSPLADIQSKGLAAVQRSNITFFGVMIPLLVGGITFFVFRSMLAHSPATVHTSFLLLAAVVFKMRGFVEFTVLHVAYVVALGWIMPMLWVA